MKSPRISVLMPTYNFARYLPEAIESVLHQNFKDFELLIVDDASKDNSAEIIKAYAARDSRVRYKINSPNLGMVPNWNLCMDMACGEYLKFLFGDDALCSRDALGTMVEMLDKNPKATLAASARKILDENSQAIDVWSHLGKSGVKNGIDVIVDCLAQTRNLVGEPSVVMFRKRDAERKFDTRYRQLVDQEYWFYLLGRGDLIYTSEPLCSFRTHPQQQTAVNRVNQVGEREHILLLKEYYFRPEVRQRNGRQIVFNNLYRLRKNRGTLPASDIEGELAESLGSGWYALYWLKHRLLRPFDNLQRSIEKRSNRRKLD